MKIRVHNALDIIKKPVHTVYLGDAKGHMIWSTLSFAHLNIRSSA